MSNGWTGSLHSDVTHNMWGTLSCGDPARNGSEANHSFIFWVYQPLDNCLMCHYVNVNEFCVWLDMQLQIPGPAPLQRAQQSEATHSSLEVMQQMNDTDFKPPATCMCAGAKLQLRNCWEEIRTVCKQKRRLWRFLINQVMVVTAVPTWGNWTSVEVLLFYRG